MLGVLNAIFNAPANIQGLSICGFKSAYFHMQPFIYLFGVLRRFQHCTGHITMGSWKGRANQTYSSLGGSVLPTIGKQLPALPCRESNPGLRGGRRECYHSATMAPHMQPCPNACVLDNEL